jgi:serine/threonine-protein kinase
VPKCPTCAEVFEAGQRFCPDDGAVLDATEEIPTVSGSDPLIGRVLENKYRLDEKIGVGGMGSVYRGRHLLMDKKVAIKVVRPEVASEENSVKRFQREAKHSCRLDHEGCVRVTDFGCADDGLLFLVMEYLDGKTVGEEIHYDGPMRATRVAHIGAQVARALDHAHGLGIIHRDLKPDNIMLLRRDDDPDAVKVLDFGLAKLLEREDAELGVTNPSLGSLTEAGVVFGTPEYMSPEQASGNPLDPRTDLYSLGAVMYQMVTGMLPFSGATFMAILTKHVTEPAMPPAARRADLSIPIELDRVIMHCLEKDPEARPASGAALARTLEQLATSMPMLSSRVPQTVAAAATIDLTAQLQASGASTLPVGLARAGAAPPPARIPESIPEIELTDPIPALPPRRSGGIWIAAAIAVAVAGVALAVKLAGGSDADRSGAQTAARPTPNDATAPPTTIDAGAIAAASPDAAPAPPPVEIPDAAPRSVDRQHSAVDPALARHIAAAESARKQKRWLKVIAEADQALRLDTEHQRAAFLMGEAQLASGDKANGCRYLRRVGRRWRASALARKAGCGD